MRLVKRLINNAVEAFGYEIFRKVKDNSLFGLERFPIKTILDIGANRGQFARRALSVFPDAKIFCFEPLPAPLKELENWSKVDPRVFPCPVALGAESGEVTMHLTLDQDDSSSMLKITENCVKTYPVTGRQATAVVKQSTLDEFMTSPEMKGGVAPELLIKVDVQGYEPNVIRGGAATFGRARAAILEVCIDDLYEGQASFKQIFSLMDGMGFVYKGNLEQGRAADGHVTYFDAVFIKER